MSEVKQVKVDNWGIFFLQKLKNFFNRTDYCDLTLQFQDNAQLKVHRLVLSACTEYFELLERTCEMYEDCLVMPDDLQADVVVPIVNFMYTGHLEFRMDLLERLYQTSQILNIPVLSKLLESHRTTLKTPAHSYSGVKRFPKTSESSKVVKPTTTNKRSYSKAFENNSVVYRDKKVQNVHKTPELPDIPAPSTYQPPSPTPTPLESSISSKKACLGDPRPTRYELPEELDNDNVFDNSFCNISYTCKPLMIHPDNVKRYSSKRSGIFSEASSSKKLLPGTSTVDIVQCRRISKEDNIFDDNINDGDDLDIFQTSYNNETVKDTSQLFDQILDDGPKVTIETKDSKAASHLDHAKIISEVLKKYPHLVKSHKNIKLKILNTPGRGKKQQKASPTYIKEEKMKPKLKTEEPDYTYETDVIDSQQAAKLIAMGAENTKGPWICLICGTPGKALHFTSYYKFRRHLVDIHNEKPVANICEYCGLRSLKRNYLLHHLYSQHGVTPPPQYKFPKCNRCNYIALTEGLLVKHKITHSDVKNFRCNVCSAPFNTTKQLLQHIQATGHKYSAERKTNLQCIYCLKGFLRDGNLFAHLKTYHKKEAKSDGIIEDSDEEKLPEEIPRAKFNNREGKYHHIKFEPSTSYDNEYEEVDLQYQIQQRPYGNIQVSPRKQHNSVSNTKQKILNPGFGTPKPPAQKTKPTRKSPPEQQQPSNFLEDMNIPSPPMSSNHNEEEIVLINNCEYIMRENQLIPRKKAKSGGNDYIISDMMESASLQTVQPTTSMDYKNDHNSKILEEALPSIVMKKTTNLNQSISQPIQIVVSNEEEYKALMSSNHPILFDNGDSNKTLVLAAQHNSTMEAAHIDLDNAQSNDMMIIQEDYPLNVTEAVSTDNSNIVVVYSHPVDDHNKQFQILTTGGIGSQFVQSSAIITQNYETVTTTGPVMSAHVLETQPDTTWQDSVQSGNGEQVSVDSQPELQNVVPDVEIKPFQHEISMNNNLNELAEEHLAPEQQTSITQENIQENLQVNPQEDQDNDNSNELNIVNTEHVDQAVIQEIEEESHNIPQTEMETDVIRESIVEEEESVVIEPIQMLHDSKTIPEVLTNDVIAQSCNQEIDVQESMATESIVEQTNTVTVPHEEPAEDSLTEAENSEITENDDLNTTLEDQQPLPESQAYDDIVEINHVNKDVPPTYTKEAQAYDDIVEINHVNKDVPPTYTKEVEAKIQNLTLEWSEDEYDVPEDTPTTLQNIHNAEGIITQAEPEMLEETIENIQQEVQNHLANARLNATIDAIPDVETEESENSIPEDTVPSPQDHQLLPMTETTIDPVRSYTPTPQKISSLLNDWEITDSQEETNCDDPATDGSIEKNPKTDKIKSLVSDWDDDEDDIKED